MTKMKKVSLICVIIMSMSTLIIYFINCTNIKYDISDAVTQTATQQINEQRTFKTNFLAYSLTDHNLLAR